MEPEDYLQQTTDTQEQIDVLYGNGIYSSLENNYDNGTEEEKYIAKQMINDEYQEAYKKQQMSLSISNTQNITATTVEPDEFSYKNTNNALAINKALKFTEDELKYLNKIQDNINLLNNRKKEITNQMSQNYYDDIEYKNNIIQIYNYSIMYAHQRSIQFFKSYDNNSVYYRINSHSKKKKLSSDNELYSLLGMHIKIYNNIKEVQLFDDTLILVLEYLSLVKDELFDPINNIEWVIYNNMKYQNTFIYSNFLKKRILIQERNIKQQIVNTPIQQEQQYNSYPSLPLQTQVVHPIIPFDSTMNKQYIDNSLNINEQLSELNYKLQIDENSIIKEYIRLLSKDDFQFQYLMNWLAHFFQTMNMSARAIILIGDSETTNILINNIIKPIFAAKKKYFSTINDDILKKDDNAILKNKIFYHIDIDNISQDKIKRVNNLLRTMIKPNNIDIVTALEEDEICIYGETIVTSSTESPYLFIKDGYSKCSVFNVTHVDTILKQLNIDKSVLDELIQNDLHNFSNILARYQLDKSYFIIAQTNEKNALSRMKKGIILTRQLENNIQKFINAIKIKDLDFFLNLMLENDTSLEQELIENFEEDAIYQPKLAEYFNIVFKDIIFTDNSYFIEILKERECLFNQAADDKFKLNGQRRYKIFKYKLAKNYQGNCSDTI